MLVALVLDCFGALRSKFVFSKVLLQKVVQQCTNDTNSSQWSNIRPDRCSHRTHYVPGQFKSQPTSSHSNLNQLRGHRSRWEVRPRDYRGTFQSGSRFPRVQVANV
jgi:hypothetical protein